MTDRHAGSPLFESERSLRERQNVIWALRALFLILSVVVLSLGIVTGSAEARLGLELAPYWWVGVGATLIFFAVIVALDVLTPGRKLSTISAIIFGSFMGLLATIVLSFVIDVFTKTYDLDVTYAQPILTAKVLLGLGLCYLGITTVLQTQDDFRLVIPYVEFSRQYRGARPLLVDSSALIDGRVVELAELGLFKTPIVIPRFVVDELQLLSDANDASRRARGRRGLDAISRLRRSQSLDITIDETSVAGSGADQMLVERGSALGATIVTTDWGLARVAGIKDVEVINVNQLARVLRPNVQPGEELRLRLIRPGEQEGQAVGFLEDGTMIVVADAAHLIGESVEIDVTGTTQTSAGRLVFARLRDDQTPPDGAPDGHAEDARVPGPPQPAPDEEPRPQPDATRTPHTPLKPSPSAPREGGGARNPRRRA